MTVSINNLSDSNRRKKNFNDWTTAGKKKNNNSAKIENTREDLTIDNFCNF